MKRFIQNLFFLLLVLGAEKMAYAQIEAGDKQEVCDNQAQLKATPTTGYWEVVSGSCKIDDKTNYNTTITNLGYGPTTLSWNATVNGVLLSDEVTIFNHAVTKAVVMVPEKEVCEPSWTLVGSTPIQGAGIWKQTQGSGHIINPSSALTQVTELGEGLNVFTWTITKGACVSVAEAKVTNNTVVAQAQEITNVCGDKTNLNAVPQTRGTAYWSVVSGGGTIENSLEHQSAVSDLLVGANVFRWSVELGSCKDSKDVWLINNLMKANTYIDENTVCDGKISITAEIPPTGFGGSWEVVKGSGNFDNSLSFFVTITEMDYGLNEFKWTVGRDGCLNSSITQVYNSAVYADAGKNRAECDNESTLKANELRDGESGKWTIFAGSGDIENTRANITHVTRLAKGSNVFRWVVTSPDNKCTSKADVEIVNNDFIITAGQNQTVCLSSAVLSAQLPLYGNGVWTVDRGEASIDNSVSTTTIARNLKNGTTVFRWTATANDCFATSTVAVTNTYYPAYAGEEQSICGAQYDLLANDPAPGYGRWKRLTGSAVLADPSSRRCRVTNLAHGLNTFRWTIKVGKCETTEDVKVFNNSVTAEAGKSDVICENQAYLNATLPANSTGFWSVKKGQASFSNSLAYNAIATCSRGENVLTWTVNYINCKDTDELTITNETFDIDAGEYQVVELNSANINASALKDGQRGQWSVISGSGVFNNSLSPSTFVEQMKTGVNVFAWTVDNDICTLTDYVDVVYAAFKADAGKDLDVCGDTILQAKSASTGKGLWKVLEGEGSFLRPYSERTEVKNIARGRNVYEWSITENGFRTADTIVVNNHSFDIDAGANLEDCGATVQLLGEYKGDLYQGHWTVVEGTGKFTGESEYNTLVYDYSPGENVYRWKVTDQAYNCTASDLVTLYSKTPPIAEFELSEDDACSPLTVSFANRSQDFLTHTWSFGDGEESELLNPDHAYYARDTVMNYLVELVVRGGNACTDTARKVIRVKPEYDLDFELQDDSVRLPQALIEAEVTEGKGFSYYRWNLEDGTTYRNEEKITHLFDTQGDFNLQLIARNAFNCQQSVSKPIHVGGALPLANFSADPIGGCAPLVVKFTNYSNNYDRLQWEFGEGTSVASTNPSFIFEKAGEYQVKLTATSTEGVTELTKVVHVEDRPVVDFKLSDEVITSASQPVSFTNLSLGEGLSYEWEFGDGNTSTEEHPIHIYQRLGSFNVKLTASTTYGCVQHKIEYNTIEIDYALSNGALTLGEPKAYPVPAQNMLTVRFERPSTSEIQLAVYALTGAVQYVQNYPAGLRELQVPVSQLKVGSYFLKLQVGTEQKKISFQVSR